MVPSHDKFEDRTESSESSRDPVLLAVAESSAGRDGFLNKSPPIEFLGLESRLATVLETGFCNTLLAFFNGVAPSAPPILAADESEALEGVFLTTGVPADCLDPLRAATPLGVPSMVDRGFLKVLVDARKPESSPAALELGRLAARDGTRPEPSEL